jgi:hypothetical protein
MNARIKLLAEQAYDELVEETGNIVVFDEDLQQRFAQLIVRECAGRVDHILREKKDGGGTMGDEIREHFGVEE